MRSWIALALLAGGLATPALADVKAGVDAWSRGDYTRAIGEWSGPAAAGDPDAAFNLAQAYKLGKGVTADLKRAETLYLQAAQQGHLQAADNYGLILFQTGRRATAMAWLVPSAERGEPRAQYVLGIAHFNGDLVPQDPVRAYALMTRAAAAGLQTAKDSLATMDAELPLAQRQQGVALAAELESKANATRATQLAAVGLGDTLPPQRLGNGKGNAKEAPAALRPVPVTAGADFAKPVVLTTPKPTPTPTPTAAATTAPTKPSPAKSASPVPTVKPSPAATPIAKPTGNWRVQLGAFGVAGNAQGLWAKLKGHTALAGREAFFVPAGKLTKLQAGPFATRTEAQAACAKLAGQACLPVQ
jgi:cell division septation protein DedD